MFKKLTSYLLFLLFGLSLLALPLLRDFHFESAMLAGIIACFWAGYRSANKNTEQDLFPTLRILLHVFTMGLPLFIFSLFTGCLTFDGFGFWVLIPVPSAFFGASIGRLTRYFKISYSRSITILLLVVVALGIWLLEFLQFPQVYFYNHVWGLWPGPIYDESVQLGGSFIFFRWLTFLWILLLWMLPKWDANLQSRLLTGLALVSLLFSYFQLDTAGIISPREYLQSQLAGSYSTEHFEIYYDEGHFTEDEIRYWAAKHEFYFDEITNQLEIEWPDGRKVESYLYAHAWQKKKLTGAKFTSYVPIWLEQDQLHIAKQQLSAVLKHELVHVISKQFGNTLFNGSWSIGLIEGIAEAIAQDASSQSTLHQLVASQKPLPSSDAMKAALSPWGFYKDAGSVSYTTTGSFVRFLLDEYPISSFKSAYNTNDLDSSYPVPFDSLVSEWHQTLMQVPIDSIDRDRSNYLFGQLSIFQKPCPHAISQEWSLWDLYQLQLADGDTTAAYSTIHTLYERSPENDWITDEWARTRLHLKNYEEVIKAIPDSSNVLRLKVLKADALFLNDQFKDAGKLLNELAPEIRSSSSPVFRHSLELRADSAQWAFHTGRRYLEQLPDSAEFDQLNKANQLLSLQTVILARNDSLSTSFAQLFLNKHALLEKSWFNVAQSSIDYLSFIGEFELARQMLNTLPSEDLRLQYQQRLEQNKRWLSFMRANI